LGQSPPKQQRHFSLHKTLDKVLKKVGAKPAANGRPQGSEDSYTMPEDGDQRPASRRSSVSSQAAAMPESPLAQQQMHLPQAQQLQAEACSTAEERHRIMPSWQVLLLCHALSLRFQCRRHAVLHRKH
jgi:hypothetical protein